MTSGRHHAWLGTAVAGYMVALMLPAVGQVKASTTSTFAVQVTTPSPNQLFYPGPVTFQGTASDSVTIISVKFDVQERETGLWLQAGGTWAPTAHYMPAQVASPGMTSTSWGASLSSLPSGDYQFAVAAKDSLGYTASASAGFGEGAAPTPTSPGYLTLLFGRTIWTATASPSCAQLSGQPTLLDIAKAIAPRAAASPVVTKWIGASTEQCVSNNSYPSWADLAVLRDQYGWTMTSEGETHANMLGMTQAQQTIESCGSLTDPNTGLYAHGHALAWGMFAYANNTTNDQIQTSVVDRCFAFGRTYRGGRNVRSQMMPHWYQQTNSVLGGTCNEPQGAYPCTTKGVRSQLGVPVYYQSPISLNNLMNVASDEWVVVQMYKLVSGAQTRGTATWDCTNADWHLHWTSQTEMYCYNDFLAAVGSIPPNVETVDPAYVAQQWNINPAVTQKPLPVVEALAPAQGPATGGTTVTISGSNFMGTAGVAFGSQQATSFSVTSDSQLVATSPSGIGAVDVTVTTNKGLSSSHPVDQFTYVSSPVVTSVSPNSGSGSGGTTILITGTGFTNAVSVDFGPNNPASPFTVSPDGTNITVTAPAGAVGPVDVTVTTPGGTSQTTNSDQFAYV